MNNQPDSYIAAHQAAERHQQRLWGLGLLFVGLHIGYVAFPLLPIAGTQAWLPWMALLPPLFACGYAVVMLGMLRWATDTRHRPHVHRHSGTRREKRMSPPQCFPTRRSRMSIPRLSGRKR